jgi:hypothetical protein
VHRWSTRPEEKGGGGIYYQFGSEAAKSDRGLCLVQWSTRRTSSRLKGSAQAEVARLRRGVDTIEWLRC